MTFAQHMAMAHAWVSYNSASGRSTEKQALRVMRQLTADDLVRMLGERNVPLPIGCAHNDSEVSA